ncbi:MAG: hypothetical protein NWT08_05365 [Akkermansiaceae bacterium]|jgi:hypothetical protein|nr:hypothetical protein [Akkermansiaceae bacterium]MDP4647233.1 hypothetical protein [Akkermansiaceae bacterium]MDP4719600.1 hypothetical protein [Akkermansiaceae bacterium]MDP4780889.1 hypothetical protein [Akkermansiaceae bacterium]MDP4846535.1 hypothetical protein [Akkermansiaceae bacterium]
MLPYFAKLKTTKLILWCYLVWYVAIICQYFDQNLNLWLSSLGIAALIGFALNLASRQGDQAPERWVIFRLYLFPFCVSSYSALIKGKGFFLLFPPELKPMIIASSSCLLFLVFALICKKTLIPS